MLEDATALTELDQRTDAWLAARTGRVTASRIADVMARTKSGYSASRASYMADLLLERLTGKPRPHFTNAAMQHGIDTEPQARGAYEFKACCDVKETGFHIHPKITMAGASPDGLIGNSGIIEIKCPQPNAHLDILRTEKVPQKYLLQMQWQMACTGREWCDFVSFQPDFPDPHHIFITRIERDNALIGEIENEVVQFLHELEAELAPLKAQMETN